MPGSTHEQDDDCCLQDHGTGGDCRLVVDGRCAGRECRQRVLDINSERPLPSIMRWDAPAGGGFLGASAQVRTNCMAVSDPVNDFITNEFWVIQGSFWVETGMTIGPDYTTGGFTRYPKLYWAEQSPTVNYQEHFLVNAALNSYYGMTIKREADRRWSVDLAGVGTYSSSSTFSGAATRLQGGTEVLYRGGQSFGSLSSLTYRSLSGQDLSGWQSGSGGASPVAVGSGMHIDWSPRPYWFNSGFGATC